MKLINKRYYFIDGLRWIAIILMVLFHIYYTWINIFWFDKIIFSKEIWYYIWKISAFLFFILAWISYYLAQEKYKENIYKKYFFISLKLWFLALVITLITYLFFSEQLIIFWVLHFFALSFLILPYFLERNILLQILIIFIIFIWKYFILKDFSFSFWFIFWFGKNNFYSADYYPLIPYFFFLVFWFYLMKFIKKKDSYKILNFNLWKIMNYLWKKSLIIYLIHVPFIYIFFTIFEKMYK